jgi:hypothetical protein
MYKYMLSSTPFQWKITICSNHHLWTKKRKEKKRKDMKNTSERALKPPWDN